MASADDPIPTHPPPGGGVCTLGNGRYTVKDGTSRSLTMTDSQSNPGRILAVVPAHRFAGFAVIDGYGIPDGGFETWKLERWESRNAKALAFAGRLIDALHRFKPAVVVLGIPPADSPDCQLLRAAARRELHPVPVIERSVMDGRRLILGRQAGSSATEFFDRIVTGFFPHLERFVSSAPIVVQYRRHAFGAAALALAELVDRAPRTAAALARPSAFDMGTFSRSVTAAELRRNPEPYGP